MTVPEGATKFALHEPYVPASGTKIALHTPPHCMCGIKLALLARNGPFWRVSCVQGELCTALATNNPCRANFVPHTRWMRSQSTQPHTKCHRCEGRRRVRRARLRCPWAAAVPGLASRHQLPPVWRAPDSLAAVPVGGGRARAGLEIDHSEPKARVWRSRGRAAAHRHIQRPGPTAPGTPAAPRATQQPGTAPAPRHTKNRHPDRMSACGGARGIRTPDLLIANETRYQLRHSPKDSNSLAPSQSAVQADHRRVRHDTEPTHATAPRARRPAARHQQLRGPYWARRASRTASRSRATA